jgi:NAD(P)-dependent dehydrogenase (short-subunit alcohol dehydrogenase family)
LRRVAIDLVLVARNGDRLSDMATELKERYAVSVETIVADLGVRSDVIRIAERLTSTGQPIDMLINNAGFGIGTKLTDADTTPHEHAIDVMITAVLMLGAAAGRAMRERGSGTIINVSSTGGLCGHGQLFGDQDLGHRVHRKPCERVVRHRSQGHGAVSWLGAHRVPPAGQHQHQLHSVGLWLDADRLVADCLQDAAAGKVISIPSKRYKILMTICVHLPHRAVRRLPSDDVKPPLALASSSRP